MTLVEILNEDSTGLIISKCAPSNIIMFCITNKKYYTILESTLNDIFANKYGIMGGGFFMMGSPTETLGDMEKTYKFIRDYCKNHFSIQQTVPLPGTEVWEYAVANKIISKNFYDSPQKEFSEVELESLLSKEVSKEDFEKIFSKTKSLHINKTREEIFHKLPVPHSLLQHRFRFPWPAV